MKTFTIKTNGPFSLRLTVLSHGFCQIPPFQWNGKHEKLLMAVKAVGGRPFTVSIKQASEGVEVSRPGGALSKKNEETVRKTVTHCLRLSEDYSGFYKLCETEPLLKSAVSSGAGRMLRSPSVYEDVVKSICGTNVAWKQAVKMIHAISQLGETSKGSDINIFPEPEKIVDAGADWLKKNARVGYRAEYIVEFCKRVADGDLDLSQVYRGDLDGYELKELFLSIKGIGKATAHYLLMLHGEYSNIVIDSLTHAFMKQITGKKMTDKQIERRYNRYGKWKALAAWYEWISFSDWLEQA